MTFAASSSAKECLNNMATERIVARGLAIPLPAISGADPWQGSYNPQLSEFKDAEGYIPIDPVNMAEMSDRI